MSGVFVAMFSEAQIKLNLTLAAESFAKRNKSFQCGSIKPKSARPIRPNALIARSRISGSELPRKPAICGTQSATAEGYFNPISARSHSAFALIFSDSDDSSDFT